MLKRFRQSLRELAANKIKLLVLLLLGSLFMLTAGLGFYRVITYTSGVPLVGFLILMRFLSIVFLSVFILLLYSSVITAFSTLYFSGDNDFLRTTPLETGGILMGKLISTLFYSSWMSLVIFIPLLFSLGYFFRPDIYAYPVFISGTLLFFTAAAALGCTAVVLIVQVFPARKVRDLLIAGLVVSGTVLYAVFRAMDLETLLRPGQESSVAGYLSLLALPRNIWSPAYWLTALTEKLIRARGGWAAELGMLAVFAVFSTAVYYAVSLKFFYSGWEKVKSRERKRYFSAGVLKNPLLAKDVKNFFRDTGQWVQALLIFAVTAIYIVNIHKLPLDLVPYSNHIVAFLNIGMIIFVMTAVSLRFTFSSISLEGRCFWILLSAPLETGKLIRLKFIENLIPVQLLGLTLVLVSNRLLNSAPAVRAVSTAVVFFSGFALTCLAMGMGCVYPKLDAGSPADIETSWGGIMYMIAGIFYIILILGILVFWARGYFIYSVTGNPVFRKSVYPVIAGLVLLNAAVCWLPMRAGLKSLSRIEV